MTIVDGRPSPETSEEILDALIADAKEYWGEDINDNTLATFRIFYRPIADRLAEAQIDIGAVLDAAQIDHASGQALDYKAADIGVVRHEAQQATGMVTFSRATAASVDYTIPAGTVVQTDSTTPIKFTTDASATLVAGNTSIDVAVTAVNGGTDGNVGSNTLTVMPAKPVGIDSVTNAAATSGGTDREKDEELRARAKTELATGSRASAKALVSACAAQDGVTSASIFINNGNLSQIPGQSADGFELVVAGGNDNEIAQAIRDTMAGGDTDWGGYNGTAATGSADLGNGQTLTVNFSRPSEVTIYIDMSLDVTDEYDGDDAVRDRVVDYIGGLHSSGQSVSGLEVGDDVIYGEIEYAIRDVDGVYDITDLQVATSSPPSGTANIAISASDIAVADATDSSIGISTTVV